MRPPIAWAITALFALFSSVALRPAQAIPLACPGPARLVSAGAVWRYRDTGLDPGAAWTTAEYDDSGWGSGTAQLGYGDGDETTLVGYGPDGNNKYVTTWFRRAFSVTDPGGLISLTLLVVRDDGAIVHLNGRPVFTSNMPVGAILSSTFAASVVGGADESAWFSASVAAGVLQTGTNILAVETHQANVASSDISFDLALCGWPSGGAPTPTSTPTETPRPTLPPPPPGTLRFASVGDFGSVAFQPGQFPPPRQVADLIRTWNPEFVVTVGDNNYCSGSQFDACVGGYYHDFISPYTGAYGGGAAENRFWPALGNHDWDAGIANYTTFFSLPGNARYYDFVRGSIHFFVLDSDGREPDGNARNSAQGQWFSATLAASTSRWNIVSFHHPAYSSAAHGNSAWMQWPFAAMGANAVLNGHDHAYERLDHGIPYFVNGAGGQVLYPFGAPTSGSVFRYNADYGAMLIEATDCEIVWRFITRANLTIDTYIQAHPLCVSTPTPTPAPTSTATPSVIPTETPTRVWLPIAIR